MKKGIREKGQCHNITAHDRKVTWKIGLIAGHAAGLPPGIKEGPYLTMTVRKVGEYLNDEAV